MADQRSNLKPREDAGRATAENGVVVLDGPNGVAVTMTVEAAERTAESLRQAADEARASGLHLNDRANRTEDDPEK